MKITLGDWLKQQARAQARHARIQASPTPRSCPDRPAELLVCPTYKLIVTADVCGRCKADPLFKQGLFATYIRNRAGRIAPCAHATRSLGRRTVTCCGGKKTAEIAVMACSVHGQVCDPDCHVCPDYVATNP
jgi:hypothetical protein